MELVILNVPFAVTDAVFFAQQNAIVIGVVIGLLSFGVFAVKRSRVIVPDDEQWMLLVWGRYRKMLDPGQHFVPPFVSETLPIRPGEHTVSTDRETAITTDNQEVAASATLTYSVVDPAETLLSIDNHRTSMENLAATTLRATIGDYATGELDQLVIESQAETELGDQVKDWGIRILEVDIDSMEVEN